MLAHLVKPGIAYVLARIFGHRTIEQVRQRAHIQRGPDLGRPVQTSGPEPFDICDVHNLRDPAALYAKHPRTGHSKPQDPGGLQLGTPLEYLCEQPSITDVQDPALQAPGPGLETIQCSHESSRRIVYHVKERAEAGQQDRARGTHWAGGASTSGPVGPTLVVASPSIRYIRENSRYVFGS